MKQIEVQSFWLRHLPQLRSFIYSKVKNTDDTKDLLQEIFIKAYQNIEKLQTDEKAVSWIYSIARNTVYRFFQTQRAKVVLEDTYSIAEPLVFAEENKTLKELAMNCLPLMEEIQAKPALNVDEVYQLFLLHFPYADRLPYKYAEALILTDIKGLTQQQLAEHLGISWSGAKSRVQRGREKLKELLMECCEFEFDSRGRVMHYFPKKKTCEMCIKA